MGPSFWQLPAEQASNVAANAQWRDSLMGKRKGEMSGGYFRHTSKRPPAAVLPLAVVGRRKLEGARRNFGYRSIALLQLRLVRGKFSVTVVLQ